MKDQKITLGKTMGISQEKRKQERLTETVKPYVLGRIKAMGPVSVAACLIEVKNQCSNIEIMRSSDYDIEIYMELALNELLHAGQIEIQLCGISQVNFI